ncbi:hypothetical protein [Vibrio sp. EA2]|uniref:hypothetical protein n=1 Tax=Vibrio sp. EA2 TaxID=3079860 RepID=UPI00294919A1|nr:hypothetical protein [Vibrio sp. EA2]MDV6251653.1 hypothetical protein [Vibrio sp. EA2]
MFNKKMLFVGLSFALLSGCTSVQYNGSQANAVTKIDYPPVGEVRTAYVGDHLVSKGTLAEMSVLRVTNMIKSLAYDIPQGDYNQLGYDHKQQFFSPVGVIKAALADPIQGIAVENNQQNEVCFVTIFGAKSCVDDAYGKFSITKKVSEFHDSFQQTLIYSGKVGNKINISYREFSNSRARPAFNNEAEYDLGESNQIGYKGAVIDVLEADNTKITYRLVRNFPD